MGIGDIVFPDNPKRRTRAAELANDIKAFAAHFDQLKSTRDATALRLKPKLLKLLDHHGLSDPAELERKIEASLGSEEMKKYRDLNKQLSESDDIETIIMGLIDFVAASAGNVIGIGFVAGVATAGAALVAVGEVLAVVAALVAILSVIEGFDEREKLRSCIVDLIKKRVDVRITLGQMEAITTWIGQVETWMDNLEQNNHDVLDKLVSSTLANEYKQWTREYAEKDLAALDKSRSSWCDEDNWHESLGVTLLALPDPILMKMK